MFLGKRQWKVSDFFPHGTIWLIWTKTRCKYNFNAKATALNTAFKELRTRAFERTFTFKSSLYYLPPLPPFQITGIVVYSYVFPPYQFKWVLSSSKQTFNPIQIAGTQVSQQLFPQCESKPLSEKHKSCKTNVWRRASSRGWGGRYRSEGPEITDKAGVNSAVR